MLVLLWSLVLSALFPYFATFTSLSVFVGLAVALLGPFISLSLSATRRAAILLNTAYVLAAILFVVLAAAGIGV